MRQRKQVSCMKVTLYITMEPGGREKAEQEVLRHLMPWFSTSLTPPYPAGTLIQFEVAPETAMQIQYDPTINSHGITIGKTV